MTISTSFWMPLPPPTILLKSSRSGNPTRGGMNVLAITKAGLDAPTVWVEAGIHAREWIAPAVATYITRELVENYSEHPQYLDNLNWYILPSANPDGYMYSWEHERLWRKTRSDTGSIRGCKGVDPNRNWGFHWAENGVSFNKCSDIYAGPKAFSEVENRNIKKFVESLTPTPVLAHCFHSYSQLWLWPYGYKHNAFPENKQEIKQLAIDASDDWYKGVLGARFSFTTELRDTGRNGFLLPPSEIIPSGEEIWAGFEVVMDKILQDL